MASLDIAYQDNNLAKSEPPKLFQQALPQFEVKYPFWNQNMRQLLMIKQQSPGGDNYMKYTIEPSGLKNYITREHEPFYILCNHNKALITKNGSHVCENCGWFMLKTQPDQTILERTCKHPNQYCIINHGKQIQQCGQCAKVIKFGCNINNI